MLKKFIAESTAFKQLQNTLEKFINTLTIKPEGVCLFIVKNKNMQDKKKIRKQKSYQNKEFIKFMVSMDIK